MVLPINTEERSEEFHVNGNSKETALEMLNSRIQLWMNSLQVRGKNVVVVNKEETTHKINAVNWTAKCRLIYKVGEE